MSNEKYLELDNDAFFVKGDRYNYSDITEIEFYYVQTQKKMNLFNSGIDYNVDVKIFINSQAKPLKINAGPKYFTLYGPSFGKESSESLIAKINEISIRSYGQRILKYLNSLEKYGYFYYDNKKFFLNGDIKSEKWEANFNKDKPWLKSPFLIFHEKKPAGLFKSAVRYEVNTLKDQDIYFSLMRELFSMSW